MRIAYIIPNHCGNGGTERIILEKINFLVDQLGYEVFLIDLFQSGEAPLFSLHKDVRLFNINIDFDYYRNKSLVVKCTMYLFLYIKLALKLKGLLRELHPEIVISTFSHEFWVLPLVKNNSKILVENHHPKDYQLIELEKRNLSFISTQAIKWKEAIESKYINAYDTFVCLTKLDKEQWNKSKNCYVIPNFIPNIKSPTAEIQHKKIISVGRLSFQKGYDILLDVWKLVIKKHPDWTLEILGDGEDRELLTEKISRLEISSSVCLIPFTHNIIEHYYSSSIYVMSSRYEGFGLVLIEAMYCGLPCVAFSCDGPQEIISNGIDGYLVPLNSLQEMSERISYLIENPEMRKEMSKNAKEKALTTFDKKVIMNKWRLLFEQITTK